MRRLVLSGINLFAGGTLEIYKKFIEELGRRGYDKRYCIIAFVHNKEDFSGIKCRVKYIEIPDGRKYIKRMYYENVYFNKWSKDKDIDVWIAMHDITPKVVSKKRYTYYHTPQIFYKMPLYKAKLDAKCFLRTKFYKYFVGKNIEETTGVIVQANWIKKKFERMFRGCNIIVARPEETQFVPTAYEDYKHYSDLRNELIFFYPSYPRVFKNFEIVCEACRILNNRGGKYKLLITLKGDENRYAKWVHNQYGSVENIYWLGVLEREQVERIYQKADVLIFPSTLETWGLPITEWGKYKKPMILADLPYAHETAEREKNKVFFKADDAQALASIMEAMAQGNKIEYEDACPNDDLRKDEWGLLFGSILK